MWSFLFITSLHNYIPLSPLHFSWSLLFFVVLVWIVSKYLRLYLLSVLSYWYLLLTLRWEWSSGTGDRVPFESSFHILRWWWSLWSSVRVTGVWEDYILYIEVARERGELSYSRPGVIWSKLVQSMRLLEIVWWYYSRGFVHIVSSNRFIFGYQMLFEKNHISRVSLIRYVTRAQHM